MSLENNTVDISKEAEVAAKWWKEVLKNPKFDYGSGNSRENEIVDIAIAVGNSNNKLDDKVLDKFEEVLKRKIIEEYKPGPTMTISVDYSACQILCDAAEESGFKGDGVLIFPYKTCMLIRPNCVRVGYGYKAPWELIYGEPMKE